MNNKETENTPEELEGDFSDIINKALGLLTRRRWWIGGTAVVVGLGTIAVSLALPNRYTSEATIFAVMRV